MTCTTHHICDCKAEELAKLQAKCEIYEKLTAEFKEEERQLVACGQLTKHGEGQLAIWRMVNKKLAEI